MDYPGYVIMKVCQIDFYRWWFINRIAPFLPDDGTCYNLLGYIH